MADLSTLKQTLQAFAGIDETAFELSAHLWQLRTYEKGEFYNEYKNVCKHLGFIIDGVFRTYYVNDDSKITISDKYYIAARKAGLFTKWRTAPDVRIFTTTQYNAIKSATTNVRGTYPGVSTYTTSTLTTGGSLNLYLIAPGYAGQVIY